MIYTAAEFNNQDLFKVYDGIIASLTPGLGLATEAKQDAEIELLRSYSLASESVFKYEHDLALYDQSVFKDISDKSAFVEKVTGKAYLELIEKYLKPKTQAFKLISAAGLNPTLIATGSTELNFLTISNAGGTARFVKLYNVAIAPVIGTDIPVATFFVPINTTLVLPFIDGIIFPLGLGLGTTTGVADNDVGVIPANVIVINLIYKNPS